jgi:hypothetical protein
MFGCECVVLVDFLPNYVHHEEEGHLSQQALISKQGGFQSVVFASQRVRIRTTLTMNFAKKELWNKHEKTLISHLL